MASPLSKKIPAVVVCLCCFALGVFFVDLCQAPKAKAQKTAASLEYKIVESLYLIRNEEDGPSRTEIFERIQNQLNKYAAEGWEPVSPHIDSSRHFSDVSALSRIKAIEAVADNKDWGYRLQSGDCGVLILRRARR